MRENLPHNQVEFVKRLLFEGHKQEKVALDCSISQAIVSHIATGKRYGQIPWPNGTVGSLANATAKIPGKQMRAQDATSDREITWSPAAIAYMEWSEDIRTGMLATVNEQRSQLGMDPVPDVAVEWSLYMTHPGDESTQHDEEEENRRRLATQAENRRRALVFETFQNIVEQRLQEQMNKRIDDIMLEAIPPAGPPPVVNTQLLPDQYQAMSWADIKLQANTHVLVREAIVAKNSALCEAICIIFAQLPKDQWRTDRVFQLIRNIEQHVLNSPEANNAGREKLELSE